MENVVSGSDKELRDGMADLVDSLQRADITRIFGAATVAATTLLDAVARSPIEVVLSTNDSSAVYMAEAYSRATGRLGVSMLAAGSCMAAAAGLAEAAVCDSPLMILVANHEIDLHQSGRTIAPDHRQTAAIRSLCRAVFRAGVNDEAPIVLAQAIRTAYAGERGPVLVEIPAGVRRLTVNIPDIDFSPPEQTLSASAEASLKQVVSLIESAGSVGFLVGPGCFSAEEEITYLAETLEAPVASTGGGLGVLPFSHPLFAGPATGPVTSLAERVLSSCDIVLAVGCTAAEPLDEFARTVRGRLVLINSSSFQPIVGRKADLTVQAQVRAALRSISGHLQQRERAEGTDVRELIRHEKRTQHHDVLKPPPGNGAVDPVTFFVTLRELLSGEDVLILDNGSHAEFGIGYYAVQAPRSLIAPCDSGTLGFSVPAAVAVSLALPDRRVVACVEERGLWLTGMELLTARRCNTAPVVVVFCAPQENLERSPDDYLLNRGAHPELVPVDYGALAAAYGVRHVRIRTDHELDEGLRRALTLDAPVLVEVRVLGTRA